MKIQSTLFLLLKLFIFNLLAVLSLQVHAEYYLTYSSPDFYDMCSNCQSVHRHVHHKKTTHVVHHRVHHYRSRGGLYVYYPILMAGCSCSSFWPLDYCPCCSPPNRVRSQWGDYVVFTSRPADHTYGFTEEDESSYNPDLSTMDDGRPDLEVN